MLALEEINNAVDKASMELALEKHAKTLNLDLTDYNDDYFNAKNRQASVAQYVVDSKKQKNAALTIEEVQKAFVHGVAYEQGKLSFSKALMQDELSLDHFNALKKTYEDEVSFRGESEISTNALKAINKVLDLPEDDQLTAIEQLEYQFSDELVPGKNPFKINDVFKYINEQLFQG